MVDICYWSSNCPAIGKITKEHVPPRSIFPKGSVGLITVRSCKTHNAAHCSNDEEFKNLILADNVENRKTNERFTSMRGNQRMVRDTLNKARKFPGDKVIFEYDTLKIKPVIESIVRGLYFHENGVQLPDNARILDYELNPNARDFNYRGMDRVKVNDVFTYYTKYSKDPNYSRMILYFYNKTIITTGSCI